jgi:hypothetical protein
MKSFLASLEEEDQETGDRLIGTRSVTVTIPDVDLTELGWPEAILLAHLAFQTPFPLAGAYVPQPEE